MLLFVQLVEFPFLKNDFGLVYAIAVAEYMPQVF
jgi:hypothetical protein